MEIRFTHANANERRPFNSVSCYINGKRVFMMRTPRMYGLTYLMRHDGRIRREFVELCREHGVPEKAVRAVIEEGRPMCIKIED